jgi:hypothetical protein
MRIPIVLIVLLTLPPFMLGAYLGSFLSTWRRVVLLMCLILCVLFGVTYNIDYNTWTGESCAILVLWWWFTLPVTFGFPMYHILKYIETFEENEPISFVFPSRETPKQSIPTIFYFFFVPVYIVLVLSGPISLYCLAPYCPFIPIGVQTLFS